MVGTDCYLIVVKLRMHTDHDYSNLKIERLRGEIDELMTTLGCAAENHRHSAAEFLGRAS